MDIQNETNHCHEYVIVNNTFIQVVDRLNATGVHQHSSCRDDFLLQKRLTQAEGIETSQDSGTGGGGG